MYLKLVDATREAEENGMNGRGGEGRREEEEEEEKVGAEDRRERSRGGKIKGKGSRCGGERTIGRKGEENSCIERERGEGEKEE